jgi:two-component system, NarL family, captular synthesis response regulator RcsB
MISKVLIAEDHESANISVQKTLEEMQIIEIDYAYYCDDALNKIMTAQKNRSPYDLLITDLSFEEDGRPQKISSGTALIEAARKEQPELKVIVFSAEGKPGVIESLYSQQQIDGYVRKARDDAKELKLALKTLNQQQRYFPRHLMQLVKQKNSYEFTDFDITVISLLASGIRQKNIPEHLAKKNIRPSGLSTVEKRLNQIKEVLECSTNEQLIAFCKDMGII